MKYSYANASEVEVYVTMMIGEIEALLDIVQKDADSEDPNTYSERFANELKKVLKAAGNSIQSQAESLIRTHTEEDEDNA